MNYEVKEYSSQVKSTNPDGSVTFSVGITTGIVGQPYPQFVAGDSTDVSISDYATKTGAQIKTELDAAVASYIATKYPNT